jgi:hypothetical protein
LPLARRLIEAGVPFVTVTDYGWDTHDAMFNRLKEGYTGGTVGKVRRSILPTLPCCRIWPTAGSETTLVVVMGEFGRTPKINTIGGRDHWPRVFSVVLAGGGVRGGQVVGRSDRAARARRPCRHSRRSGRTIYVALGVDPNQEFHTRDGRPVQVNQKER